MLRRQQKEGNRRWWGGEEDPLDEGGQGAEAWGGDELGRGEREEALQRAACAGCSSKLGRSRRREESGDPPHQEALGPLRRGRAVWSRG